MTEDEYVAVDLDQEGLDTSSVEETEIGAREDLCLQPDNLGASSEMTIDSPHNEPDGHQHPLGRRKRKNINSSQTILQ